mgnify:CR=1 FL=1
MPNFDKIKIDGASYLVHDTETATALSAETQARKQAIQQVENEIGGLPSKWQEYVRNIVTSYPIQTIGGKSTQLILSGFYFIANDGNFYRATKLIGQGAQIVVGSNCERTYIGAMLASLQTSINNVDKQITGQLEPLDTRVTNIEANMNSLNVYNFDTCVFIGDSYLNQNPSWGDQLASILPGCRAHYNYPSGGGGFQIAGANGSFLDMVSPGGFVYNAVQSFKNKVTFVLIEGGINDGDSGMSAETVAVTNTLNATKTLFPNARIVVVYNWISRAYPNNIWEGIKLGCYISGVPFCPNSYLWLWNDNDSLYFQSDHIHPNSTGTKRACLSIYIWLMSGRSIWMDGKKRIPLSNGMTMFWDIDESDNILFGIYGTATSSTASLGKVPYCLRPYNQSVFIPWNNVTALSGTENPYIRIDTDGSIATNATFSSQNPVSQWNFAVPARQFGLMGFTD